MKRPWMGDEDDVLLEYVAPRQPSRLELHPLQRPPPCQLLAPPSRRNHSAWTQSFTYMHTCVKFFTWMTQDLPQFFVVNWFCEQRVQALAIGRTGRDRPKGAVGEKVGEDFDVLARADGQRREELLEHEGEAVGNNPSS
ncbi:hypothetical protein BHM03_00038884 [Ensete ventricosum]|nr:hypothetical protein BHM03_00038884 [Ensete ventricosum]